MVDRVAGDVDNLCRRVGGPDGLGHVPAADAAAELDVSAESTVSPVRTT